MSVASVGGSLLIRGKNITLKPFTREMFQQYYHWRLDEEVMYWAAGEPNMSSLIAEEAFMKRYMSDVLESNQQKSGMLGIFTEEDDFIGEITYRDMDLVSGTAVLGILIGERLLPWRQPFIFATCIIACIANFV